MQTAQDAIFDFEGLMLTRSSNMLTDVIDGAAINILNTSSSNVTVNISNDKSTLKSNIQQMVSSYNDLLLICDNFTAIDSDAEMAGALSEDTSVIRFFKTKLKEVIFGDSSTPSGAVSALRNIGISVNEYGTVKFNETDYDTAVFHQL
jgi:flagellar hook-associated protein 2